MDHDDLENLIGSLNEVWRTSHSPIGELCGAAADVLDDHREAIENDI